MHITIWLYLISFPEWLQVLVTYQCYSYYINGLLLSTPLLSISLMWLVSPFSDIIPEKAILHSLARCKEPGEMNHFIDPLYHLLVRTTFSLCCKIPWSCVWRNGRASIVHTLNCFPQQFLYWFSYNAWNYCPTCHCGLSSRDIKSIQR